MKKFVINTWERGKNVKKRKDRRDKKKYFFK